MAMSTKLEMRQGQSLVMTPQLQQAIKLLQLSNLELSAFVEAELERNPILERTGADGVMDADAASMGRDAAAERETPSKAGDDDGYGDGPSLGAELDQVYDRTATREIDGRNTDKATVAGETAASAANEDHTSSSGPDPVGDLDTDYANIDPDGFGSDTSFGASDAASASEAESWASLGAGSAGGFASGDYNPEAFVSEYLSLRDHLRAQLVLTPLGATERIIADHLIDLVDDAGYLRGETWAIAEQLGCEIELVECVLTAIQGMEPTGVAARSLSECLALQLKARDRLDPIIAAVLDNLHLLARHDIPALKRTCGLSADDLADVINDIKSLDPKPGLAFGFAPIQPVVPDVIVRPRLDGAWLVELNSETLPRVLVNRTYLSEVSVHVKAGDDKAYLADCLQTANWLVKSLDQRARTILKVSEEIIRQQDAFLAHGVAHLRPLNLKTVADAISMHESTVSRVTSNKYMSTPRGLFELKYFFTSAIASSEDGDAHSSESVRHRIRQLIDAETPDRVLSDDKLVTLLKSDGIDIARRTVAKYREAMHISSSVQRRREKKLAATTARLSA